MQGLVGKYGRKKPLVKSRRRWKGNIKLDRQEVRWGMHGLYWTGSE